MNKSNRLGEENYNNKGTLMKIVDYIDSTKILIEFQDEYKYRKYTNYANFKKGTPTNPYDRTVYQIGYLGVGPYKTKENGHSFKSYEVWKKMLQRCYDPYYINQYNTYQYCKVCDEWLNYQNFAQWFYDNYYEVGNEKMCLDKDILIKGNCIYSPEACVFVPERINELFTKSNSMRGNYPIGVCKHGNKLQVSCSILESGKKFNKVLGNFDINEVEEAFLCYKRFKESYIRQIADEYENEIPYNLYLSMYNWIVEITD